MKMFALALFLILAPCAAAVASASEIGERSDLERALEKWHAQYDPAEQMIRRPFSSPGYHTTLKGGEVHPTRDSLQYAVALLDTGDPALLTRAEAILRKVIRLQDQDPDSKTYGIWSWFLEEPLAQMSPPDWNWADFCGVQLLQVARDHRHRLSPDLALQVDTAVRHAAYSVMRRNVGPGYTNIAIMGTYVTLATGELYGLEDLRTYGLQRLQRFHAYTMDNGGFTEYNSPTYTLVALSELGRLRMHAKDPQARRLIDDLYRLAWEEIAHHFHAPTRQWAGPHSRCYHTLLPDSTLALIQRATASQVRFFKQEPLLGLSDCRLSLPCPPDLQPLFLRLTQPRELRKVFVKTEPPLVGTTYLARDFALGSINRGDLWNQRRALVAYWGDAEHPSYLHVRFLHDDYDFADAQFFSVQKMGTVLAGVNFGTDGGDTHVSLDRIRDGAFRARDLRLRFELGGAAGRTAPVLPGPDHQNTTLRLGKVRIDLVVPFAHWGHEVGFWATGRDPAKHVAWIDRVLYSGEPREFRLSEMDLAAIGFGLQLNLRRQTLFAVTAILRDGQLHLESPTRPHALALGIPVKPARVSDLHKKVYAP